MGFCLPPLLPHHREPNAASARPGEVGPASEFRISARAQFRRVDLGAGAIPPRPAIKLMLAEIEAVLARAPARPVGLDCTCMPLAAALPGLGIEAGGVDYLATITVTAVADGLVPARSLASFFEWQHPRWRLCAPPPPAIEEGGCSFFEWQHPRWRLCAPPPPAIEEGGCTPNARARGLEGGTRERVLEGAPALLEGIVR